MSGVVVVDGHQWWTTGYAVAQLQVSRARLADWVRRSKAVGHTSPAAECPRCVAGTSGFPHVDPPARAGRVAGYVAEQLLEAEGYTAASARGGRARADCSHPNRIDATAIDDSAQTWHCPACTAWWTTPWPDSEA